MNKAELEKENEELKAKLKLIMPLDIQVERVRIASNEITHNVNKLPNSSYIVDRFESLAKKIDNKILELNKVAEAMQRQLDAPADNSQIEIIRTIIQELAVKRDEY